MDLKPLIMLSLLYIFYQDLYYCAVYWLCFPVLAILFVLQRQDEIGLITCLKDAGLNLAFAGIQLGLLWAYFAIKNRKPVHILKHYLGLGDVLFLMVIAFYLSPINYILFYIISLIFVLIITLFQQFLLKKRNLQIPLAGLQALLLCLILVFSYIYPQLKLYDDIFSFEL